MERKPTWRDLYQFIQEQVEKEGDSFLDNRIFFECVNPETHNKSFETFKDSEDWVYSEPGWIMVKDKAQVLTTTNKDKKIVTLNINY